MQPDSLLDIDLPSHRQYFRSTLSSPPLHIPTHIILLIQSWTLTRTPQFSLSANRQRQIPLRLRRGRKRLPKVRILLYQHRRALLPLRLALLLIHTLLVLNLWQTFGDIRR